MTASRKKLPRYYPAIGIQTYPEFKNNIKLNNLETFGGKSPGPAVIEKLNNKNVQGSHHFNNTLLNAAYQNKTNVKQRVAVVENPKPPFFEYSNRIK